MHENLWACGCGITDGVPTKCKKHEKSSKKEGELHNENGHRYGCECKDCVYEYWLLKQVRGWGQ